MWLFDWVFNVLANLGLYHKSAKIRFKTFDLGGHETARRLWKDYFTTVDGVVYMVDALDKERFSEAKRELDYLLTCDELASVPFLVLGNKIDAHSAASEDDLRYALGLFDLRQGHGPPARGGRQQNQAHRALHVLGHPQDGLRGRLPVARAVLLGRSRGGRASYKHRFEEK